MTRIRSKSLLFLIPLMGAGLITTQWIRFTDAAPAQKSGMVCADPATPCHRSYKKFDSFELSFRLPTKIKPNVAYKSVPFFGVVLKFQSSGGEDYCDGGEYSTALEQKRKRVQALFPKKKVFADHQCPNMAAVSYVIAGKVNTSSFLAVYGGQTRKEAERVVAKVKSRYRGAAIKPMQVVFEQIMQ